MKIKNLQALGAPPTALPCFRRLWVFPLRLQTLRLELCEKDFVLPWIFFYGHPVCNFAKC